MTLKATSVLSGANYWYSSLQSDKPDEQYTSGTFALNNAAVTFTQTCPQMAGSNFVAYDSGV
ncbi:MAG: hypothetical protein EXR72_26245 [Myxococcales bacterium]|nr:hypothetical protein [Myxococcales bacterium]